MKGLLKVFGIVVLCGILAYVIFKQVREHRTKAPLNVTQSAAAHVEAEKIIPTEGELWSYNRAELADVEDAILGKWEGFTVSFGRVYAHEIEVKRVGDELKGYGKIFVGLTAPQLADVAGNNFSRVKPTFQLSIVASQEYDISMEDDRLTFRGVEAKVTYTNNFTLYSVPYSLDTFSGELYQPGLFFGSATDEAGSEGSFYFAKKEALSSPPPLELTKGKIYHITCMFDQRYHYSCYVPKSYDPSQPTPVLINDDPNRNAPPLSTKMAEELGWIMAGLTESSNGIPTRICNENCAVVILDLRRRFNIHTERIYFSGMSGGARRATQRGIFHAPNCAGLICIGAGFSWFTGGVLDGQLIIPPVEQPIFFIVGKTDFNYSEVADRAHPMELNRQRAVKLIIHPEGHTWGRPEDHEAAIRWLDEQWGK